MKKNNKSINRTLSGVKFDLKMKIIALLLIATVFKTNASTYHKNITNILIVNVEVQQEQIEIKGKVYDEMNQPLPGASVLVKGTTIGTLTSFDGEYKILLPKGATTLVISYAGYVKQEVLISDRSVIDVKMSVDLVSLDAVVVVGYSSIKKESLTGSLQTINNKKITDATTPSLENLLAGKVTGVYVNSGSGKPGESGKIIIRGKTTVNGSTDPLWVVDGVVIGGSASNINPSDIETMTILKDAASTAVYGSQGANGVIVVTTKSGKSGKATVNFSTRMAATTLNTGNFSLRNGAELYDLYDSFSNKQDFSTVWWWTPELRNKNFDWWDNAKRTGLATDRNLSISGGSEDFKSYVSLGEYDEKAAISGYDYTRYNVLMKFSYKVNNWLTIRPQINATRTDVLDRQHSVVAMYLNLPWDNPYLADGTLVGNRPNPTWVNTTGSNYLYDLQWNYSESKAYNVRSNFDFDIKLTDWLTFASVNNYIFSNSNSMVYSDPRSLNGLSAKGRIEDYMSSYNRTYTNQLFKFNRSFGKHNFNAIAGYEWNEFDSKNTVGIATGFAPGFIVSDVASIPERVTGSRTQWAVQSLLSNVNYTYDNKYLAQVSLRRDGASNFGINSQYGNFFSVSGGWNIHKEDFFNSDYITKLKLRASYGSVGNRPNSLYPHYGLYSLSTSYNQNSGAIISQIANPDLSWEKTYTTGIGLDVSFLKRFNLTLDYYDKNTSDLLYQVPLPGVIGVTSIWKNVGAVSNKGFEATLNVEIVENEDWKWSVDANIGVNKNKVTSLYGERKQIIMGDGAGSSSKILTPGKDVDTWYLTEWAGVDPETGRPQWFETNANGERIKTFSYSAASKTPIAMGAYTPSFFGGFSTDLNYKSFDLSAIFTYSVGGEIYNYSRTEFDSDGAYSDRNQMNLYSGWSRWEKPGDIATHPQASYNNRSNSNKASSRFLETGTYLKMRSLSLGYSLSVKRLNISNLRIFVSAENVFTISHFSGVDPEIPSASGPTGVSTTVYPTTRKFVLGLNLTL
ncbi:TonB-linked SusC/RagA family outer membrane protein [Flavobacterium sp. CG_9.1]|uniref:SusC/RagA family TonB-linked outer membrane protein n=1 Tax=Flavobacterium sp. CG_9.1 TaxID=2787728 RepID=UPI001A1C90C4|nr:TonB-dependent receptor [Flavobacterium sp. CG_9.1]MBG6063380.1 TonB-linked SusC/RagA family outer membrane protein [Flavobacterium sp. CG_9.1]